MFRPRAGLLAPSSGAGEVAIWMGDVARAATKAPPATRAAQRTRRMERIGFISTNKRLAGRLLARPGLDIGLDILGTLPRRRTGRQLAHRRGGMGLRLGALALDNC